MIQVDLVNSRPSLMPDMTALLDVIFILLVFMMLTANAAPPLLELQLPQADVTSKSIEPNAITLGLSQQGVFSINQRQFYDWHQFESALTEELTRHQQQYQLPAQILVAADKNVALQPFIKLTHWLAEQGISIAQVMISHSDN